MVSPEFPRNSPCPVVSAGQPGKQIPESLIGDKEMVTIGHPGNCEKCGAVFIAAFPGQNTCPKCRWGEEEPALSNDNSKGLNDRKCFACGGTGKIKGHQCVTCWGSGKRSQKWAF